MLRALAAAVTALVVLVGGMPAGHTARAVTPIPQPGDIQSVELRPVGGTVFELEGRHYMGELALSPGGQGVSVVETVPLDRYLLGIREVPFSWPDEALAAQAVAARTYLAWTLQRGRTAAGRIYGFDICATTACQVYAGSAPAGVTDLDRWEAAVARTGGEILVFDGGPAQTLYSSSAGSRTRANQDVFSSRALPYLQPVDSPEAGVTPYETWTVEAPAEAVVRVLAAGGYDVGDGVRDVWVDRPPEGEGGARLRVATEDGVTSIPVTTIRWVFNDHGPELYPGIFPARRPTGSRWPQAILSYTFDVEYVAPRGPSLVPALAALLPPDERVAGLVRFVGEGWGHGVGMSQWGAKALADRGERYDEILAHYYGGLAPVDGADRLPASVAVGLGWQQGEVAVEASGTFDLVVNGIPIGRYGGGTWTLRRAPGGVAVVPPVDLVDPPGFDRVWPR